jgi:hypothetical protein
MTNAFYEPFIAELITGIPVFFFIHQQATMPAVCERAANVGLYAQK